ncbi:hypothetical protein E1B28_006508 [Marasmius oreades]|uniref:SWR1-complex protein 5 n=1 Tax=Marasmius oreades TaxID=181124 RepID=A0A9P7UVM6_9AGAR|nr:uncharacterized protein E1B28_006508 [Marasmius oreades]KAG7095808.1 hypothetical protein E1B28_006508 [Marasmius oreades]
MPESDSDDDKDYVPPIDDPESSSSDEEDELEFKCAKVTSKSPSAEEDEEARNLARENAWKSFQDSLATNSSVSPAEVVSKKWVKIERRHLFAGEEVVEVVEVPEDSIDAKKWPRWSPPDEHKLEESAPNCRSPVHDSSEPSGSSVLPRTIPANTPEPVAQPNALTSNPTSIAKRPGPRKSRTTLASLPSSSTPKKITILEKSAMVWRSHVGLQQEPGLKDELEANRRGGGYLEKVEFLERVHERKEDVLERSKGTKRKR